MIRTLATWELLLVAAFMLVVAQELVTLVLARRRGLTSNVSRLVTFASLLVLATIYGLLEISWLRFDDSAGGMEALRRLPTINWSYLILGVMISLVLAYEVSALVQARVAGKTKNLSRLLALLVAVVLLLVLLGIGQMRWNLYLQRLEAVYSGSIASSDG